MGFGENLRTMRRKKNISQEELAGKLNVSRQAISRWEQDNGYPEMEKMIALSKILNVTLDYLVSDNETADGSNEDSGSEEQPQISVSSAAAPTGRIMIRSYDGKQLVNCYKVISMHVSGNADTPNYVLYGVTVHRFGERTGRCWAGMRTKKVYRKRRQIFSQRSKQGNHHMN